MSNYVPDTWVVSILWGRTGAAILALASAILAGYGYSFGVEEQETAFKVVSGLLAAVAGGLAIVSKIRESKRTK